MRVTVASLFVLFWLSSVFDCTTAQLREKQLGQQMFFGDLKERQSINWMNVDDNVFLGRLLPHPTPSGARHEVHAGSFGETSDNSLAGRMSSKQDKCLMSCKIDKSYNFLCGQDGRYFWNMSYFVCAKNCGLVPKDYLPGIC